MHLLEITRALMLQSIVPSNYWGECVLKATYLINRIPSRVIKGKSSYQVIFRELPTYAEFKIFGCLCYAFTLAQNKKIFKRRTKSCVFLGILRDRRRINPWNQTLEISYYLEMYIFMKLLFLLQPCGGTSIYLSSSPDTIQPNDQNLTLPSSPNHTTSPQNSPIPSPAKQSFTHSELPNYLSS